MRRKIVFSVLTALLLSFVGAVAMRHFNAPAVAATPTLATPPGPGRGAAEAPPAAAVAEDSGAAPLPVGPEGRPIRVVGLGWELLVPGFLGQRAGEDEVSPFSGSGVDVDVRALPNVAAVEAALARGGADEHGADVAVVPLPAFVASYERLRALDPVMVFTVGWSHGRDVLLAGRTPSLLEVPKKGPVKLLGAPGRPATLLGLFMLDAAGVEGDRVELIAPRAPGAPAHFLTVDRPSADAGGAWGGRRVLVTTADAGALVPYVMVTPSGFLKAHPTAVDGVVRGWLSGAAVMRTDVPAAARYVATLPGAPDALALLGMLGQMEPADLADNARLVGLSGRGAVTLTELFHRSWALWRSAGVISTPAPMGAPVVSQLVLARVLAAPPVAADDAPGGSAEGAPLLRISLSHRTPADADAAAAELGFVAGVFPGAGLRVGAGGRTGKTKRVVAAIAERYGLDADRFESVPGISRPGAVSVEVVARR